MYIYLSKKISVPNNSVITACTWNRRDGFVAAGTESSLVKVIKLEMTEGKEAKTVKPTNKTAATGETTTTAAAAGTPAAANSNQSSLVMNESLESHTGEIACIAWNDLFSKLTTADTNGKIVVWINYEGQWCEEMVNKRDNTIVTGMKWSSDGQHICIVYNDGVIIMGSLEGNRVWVKELKNTVLTNIEWSPDKRLLLFGLDNGEVHIYDFNSVFVDKLKVFCLESTGVQLATIDWYDGQNGFVSPDSPALAVCYSNGRCQIMKNETDENPVLLDCQMDVMCAQWNHDGSILAIGGLMTADDKESNVVQFFNPWGNHLKTLKVPGTRLRSCSWEGTSLRIVIAIDSLIYFANMRPTYKWCYFNNTIVYSFLKPAKAEQCVMFYDLKTGESSLKYMKHLLGIVGAGDNCALISQADDSSQTIGQSAAAAVASASLVGNKDASEAGNGATLGGSGGHQTQYAIVLCNSIGTPLEYKYIDFHPVYWAMNASHIVVASRSYFYIWHYQSMVDRHALKKQQQSFEKLVFIDNPNAGIQVKTDDAAIVAVGPNLQNAKNPITCITVSEKFLFVGRESGYVQKFSLSIGNLAEVHLNDKNGIVATKISVNCTATRMIVIDTNSVMRLIDLTTKVQREDFANFKRHDVWNVVWAADNPEMFVSMEKIKMHIYRDTQAEEPQPCLGYICSFSELQVKAVFLDDIMQRPEHPSPTDIVELDTKSLKDTRELLERVNLQEASQFIEQNPHARLWRLLAESALNKLDLKTAEHAFVKSKDYYGIEFVKKLQNIPSQELKKAEVAAYFGMFDEAELMYLEMDRKDLGYQLRKKLGDWFKVLQLLKLNAGAKKLDHSEASSKTAAAAVAAAADELQLLAASESDMLAATSGAAGTDTQLEEVYNEIGEQCVEKQKWESAVKYFIMGRNLERQADCYYVLEDYDSITKVMDQLPENSELLTKLAQMFESVGMCKEASEAYLKTQNVKAAVDTCVKLNQWDEGIRLAKQYNLSQVDALLAKQANSFLEQNKTFNAIELYRKARHYLDAARLMFEVAEKESKQRNSPLLIKKMYVLAGLLVEQYRDLIKAGGILPSKIKIAQREQASKALDGLLTEESQIAMKDSKILDQAWRGAEAYHFSMLCERQLRDGKIDAAFKTSMALTDYEDLLNPKHVYSLIALCACGNGSYSAASKAFIKLESCESIDEKDRKEFETLAFQIFSIHSPKDKKPALRGDCPQCGTHINEWFTNCPSCDTKFAPCIVSGRPILEPQFWVCGSCKHRAIEQEIANRIACPLCHMPVR